MSLTLLKSTDYASISQQQLANEHAILLIEHPLCQAKVSVYGGHVLSWQPTNQRPVLWLSDKAEYQAGKAIRGGIPICWPWFGPLIDEHGNNLGNHGFARTSDWQVSSCAITPEAITLVLSIKGENRHSAWQHSFEVEQTLIFSKDLYQQLSIKNTGESSLQFGHALHSYFAVSDPKNVQLPQLQGVHFDDKITGKKRQIDELVNCVGPLDRIYYDNTEQLIKDADWQRTIKVTSNHCQQWVVWNPGKDIAATMADVHQGGETEYVCLEAANTQWVSIEAGDSTAVSQQIEVI
ncbi:D-hexose-6-phosphate mutarotase [Thalassotalea sp. 1_MG-2023]|uniref:D-hexose-6-phosphate mutarotase n=1 Tax=Thalassotalea sp. 1_MG-2023 TaxID=3062680 RepID=UPI0026E16A3A|nr:D-hexose-6-phosphate mutarotase [Thalassotalea sp. 1_MG-2023]MDO6426395.1 D-hexose-6-phosphate mutarotase [Thalassotalea sp. 1_MG-2023]